MMDLILATLLSCSESQKLVKGIMGSEQSVIDKHELIEVIKVNTKSGCYEGSELNS